MVRISMELESPYRETLEGVLSFSSFVEAEQTIRRLQVLSENYRMARDSKGVEYCRQIALLGRHRAELIGRNRRVRPEKRLQKQEMANWFRVWLETPELFDDWLALRKSTEDFQRLSRCDSSK